MSKADIRQRCDRHWSNIRRYSALMSAMLNQPRNLIARWRGMRLIVMPIIILGAGLWISSMQSKIVEDQSDRVRLVLMQIVEASAADPAHVLNSLKGSDPVVVDELRRRIMGAAAQSTQKAPLVVVRVGDFGAGAVGSATHTALACYQDSVRIGVRAIARADNPQVQIVGVFTPESADFPDESGGRE